MLPGRPRSRRWSPGCFGGLGSRPLHGRVAAPIDGLRPRSSERTPPALYESRGICRVMNVNDELLPSPGQLRPYRNDAKRTAERSVAEIVTVGVLAGIDAGAVLGAEP